MFIGQLCTLAPNFYGTAIILGAAYFYMYIFGFSKVSLGIIITLTALAVCAEVGTRWFRKSLMKEYQVSATYSVNTAVCNLAGIIVSDALFGALAGIAIWELIVGKALLPYLDHISKVLVRLIILAILRFICGIIMITIICKYIIYRV